MQMSRSFVIIHLCVGKETALLQILACGAGLQRFANVLFCGWGFLFLCVRGEKINSPQTAPPYQRSTNPVNPFFVIISIHFLSCQSVELVLLTLAYNVQRRVP